jgi:hypothetical protein
MTKTLCLASLLLASLAGAQPQPPTPPGPPPLTEADVQRFRPSCEAKGPVLFEIDHRAPADSHLETSELVVYASGAWTLHSRTGDDKPGREAAGCLREPLVRRIRADLDDATWTVGRNHITCRAMALGSVEYRANGQLVWTARVCSPEVLDATSRGKLAEIVKLLDDATAPHHPPCCKK